VVDRRELSHELSLELSARSRLVAQSTYSQNAYASRSADTQKGVHNIRSVASQ
jgi:hypothetical protein